MKSKIIKRCGDCGRFLSIDDFYWSNKKKGYLTSHCKRCGRNRTYLWRLENPEYNKHYRENNPEYHKQYRKDNKERIDERNKQYRKENPEYKKQWCKDNPEYSKQYRKNNPDIVNVLNAKRRVAKKNQTAFLTSFEKDRVRFIYEVASTMADYIVDHIQPISKGGLHHPNNLQILTAKLNLEKSNKWPLTKKEQVKYKGFRI